MSAHHTLRQILVDGLDKLSQRFGRLARIYGGKNIFFKSTGRRSIREEILEDSVASNSRTSFPASILAKKCSCPSCPLL